MVRAVPRLPSGAPVDFSLSKGSPRPKLLPVRILTHNIRHATNDRYKNEKPWEARCPYIVKELLFHTRFRDVYTLSLATDNPPSSDIASSFIRVQQCLHEQLCDIIYGLNIVLPIRNNKKPTANRPRWSYIGVGEDDGKAEGEFCPIIYPTPLFNVLHFETIWLSPTPENPSKGWDAAQNRQLTIGIFEHKYTKQAFIMANTHLNSEGPESREKAVPIIAGTLARLRYEWARQYPNGLDLAIAGDFSFTPSSETYRAMVATGLADAHEYVREDQQYGDEATFTGFGPRSDDRPAMRRVDYVWFNGGRTYVGNQGVSALELPGWMVEEYATLPNVFDNGVY